jgi:hypothetical protein
MQNVDKNQKKFFPYYFFEVAVVTLLTVEAVLLLAVVFPPSIGREIDFLAQYSPRPEWYFLFLYQFTKYFPGKWTFIGAVLLPGLRPPCSGRGVDDCVLAMSNLRTGSTRGEKGRHRQAPICCQHCAGASCRTGAV